MKTKKVEEFDAGQGHGNHIDTISSCETTEQFVCTWFRKSVQEGDVLWGTKEPIDCSLGGEMPEQMKFIAIGKERDPVRFSPKHCPSQDSFQPASECKAGAFLQGRPAYGSLS